MFLRKFVLANVLMSVTLLLADVEDYDGKIVKELKHELVPISKTVFQLRTLKSGKEKIIDLTGKNFVVVSVREEGSDGRFYAVDKDGTVWWSG